MMNITKLVIGDAAEADTSILDGWHIVEGTPCMKTFVLNTTNDGRLISGYWEATPGTYYATYTEAEFVHIISGRLTITQDGQFPVKLGPGDAFVVEAGFKGHWTIHETVRKHFAISM